MKIAILSDIHDNVWNLAAALKALSDADAMICCGDLCSPFIVDLLANGFPGRSIHIVFGNNDGDPRRITEKTKTYALVQVYGEFCEIELGWKKIAVQHYDTIAIPIAQSGQYDVVCFGHNHRYQVDQFGKTLAINPGALMGYDGVQQVDIPATFVIYDTSVDEAHGYRIVSEPERTGKKVMPYLMG